MRRLEERLSRSAILHAHTLWSARCIYLKRHQDKALGGLWYHQMGKYRLDRFKQQIYKDANSDRLSHLQHQQQQQNINDDNIIDIGNININSNKHEDDESSTTSSLSEISEISIDEPNTDVSATFLQLLDTTLNNISSETPNDHG